MLCQKCSLRDACTTLCRRVMKHLKENRDYLTTTEGRTIYQNMSRFKSEVDGLAGWVSSGFISPSRRIHWDRIASILFDPVLSDTQTEVLTLFAGGYTFSQIAKVLDKSPQAIREVLFGNSRGQGGVIRKIQKILKHQNYL
jgi:hypothetical protein